MKKNSPIYIRVLLIVSISLFIVIGGYATYKMLLNYKQYKIEHDAANNKWHGFNLKAFKFNGVDAKIVFPDQPNTRRNWIWRTQFWGHEPNVDIALLEKGFHLVYVDVNDLYGNKIAVERFDRFYEFMLKNYNLNSKVVLEGMSRGGLDVYNWASVNTGKVACIYGDAPVCDIKSWPGGFGNGERSESDWQKCLKAYGLTQETVKTYNNIPVYNCKAIAEAKIPVLHICGDKDDIVPMEENTDKLATIFRQAGGEIQIIVKKGVGHHPHSLEDPKPIVDFILKNTGNSD